MCPNWLSSNVSCSFFGINFKQWATDKDFRLTKTVCTHICQEIGLQIDHSFVFSCTNAQFQWWRRPNFWGLYLTGGYPLYPMKGAKSLKQSYWQYWVGSWPKEYVPPLISWVRSKLGCGCIKDVSARRSYLQMLDPTHSQGLCPGAFRASPVESLNIGRNCFV